MKLPINDAKIELTQKMTSHYTKSEREIPSN